jgi:hypothetical protein
MFPVTAAIPPCSAVSIHGKYLRTLLDEKEKNHSISWVDHAARRWGTIDAMIRLVKKLLLILLIMLLPLQYSWAAFAVYCQHEQEAQQTFHIGHHAHQHQNRGEDPQKPYGIKQAHSDCGVCHFSPQAAFSLTFVLGVLPSSIGYLALLSYSFSSHIPDGPHKPDWHLVA